MSTRSGKRLHTSPDIVLKPKEVKTERRTRSQKQKENFTEAAVSKKKNYVSRYPSEDETSNNDVSSQIPHRTRKSRRITLKEVINNNNDVPKPVKISRRKKPVENDIILNLSPKRNKKSRRKKMSKHNVLEVDTGAAIDSDKKVVKKKISSGSVVIEELTAQNQSIKSIEKSNISLDSFFSAAGSDNDSPHVELENKYNFKASAKQKSLTKENMEFTVECKKITFCKEKQSDINPINCESLEKTLMEGNSPNGSAFNILFDDNKKSRSSYKNSTFNDISTDNIQNVFSLIHDKGDVNKSKHKNCDTMENSNEVYKLSSPDNSSYLNNTKSGGNPKLGKGNSLMNTTLGKEPIHINTTYEKLANTNIIENVASNTLSVPKLVVDITPKKKSSSTPKTPIRKSVTIEKDESSCTFNIDKLQECKNIQTSTSTDIQTKLDATFEKESTTLNSTYDKVEDVSESSIITSDSSITNDKSILRISITSDESKAENIINNTPVIVNSSLDESQCISESENITSKEPVKSPPSNFPLVVTTPTPMRREATFTKESPTDLLSSKQSPGRTPFPLSKSSSSKRVALNVTRSIEKTQKSFISELPHATRVMFCSPINTPMITNQTKGKTIKSSMKGSNKSFVYSQEPRSDSSIRKRSYTQSDSDDLRVKRQRLGVDSTNTVPRSRTSSASGNIQTTPSKWTPSKCKDEVSRVGRKKLPNFAALHQKQFEKMESLDECQERKARRAQMLAAGIPTAKDKDLKVDAKQSQMNPGFTRFGFKMKSDDNPFMNVLKMSKDPKPTRVVRNSALPKASVQPVKRPGPLPSLAGSTARREMAKQSVMREKSIAEKSIASRNETRTTIKGVRTNRRFELQMQMRNLN